MTSATSDRPATRNAGRHPWRDITRKNERNESIYRSIYGKDPAEGVPEGGDNTLFVYGTLRSKQTLDMMLGREYTERKDRASLKDHARVGGLMIAPTPGAMVENGLVLYHLSDRDMARLDAYEGIWRDDTKGGGAYRRAMGTAVLSDGTEVAAWCYPSSRVQERPSDPIDPNGNRYDSSYNWRASQPGGWATEEDF